MLSLRKFMGKKSNSKRVLSKLRKITDSERGNQENTYRNEYKYTREKIGGKRMKGQIETRAEYQRDSTVVANHIKGSPALAAVIRSGRRIPFFIPLLCPDYEKTVAFIGNVSFIACH
jgi:hypothetical protein